MVRLCITSSSPNDVIPLTCDGAGFPPNYAALKVVSPNIQKEPPLPDIPLDQGVRFLHLKSFLEKKLGLKMLAHIGRGGYVQSQDLLRRRSGAYS